MAAYDDKSPLETAIACHRMEIWNIMREGLELTEKDKLEQLCRMIVSGKMDQDDPWKEFKELLSSLPVELVLSIFLKGACIVFAPLNPSFIRTIPSPIKDLYQVNSTSVEAKGSSEEKRTLLQVRKRFPRNQCKFRFFTYFFQHS